jgi:hypothetical protein
VASSAKQPPKRLLTALLYALGALTLATSLFAQTKAERKPQLGQPGKDIIWLPSPQVLVDRMLDMAKVTRQDTLMDLGSGDGRLVIAAAQRGARAVGIEYDASLVELSRKNAALQHLSNKATFIKADLFKTDLSKATVITLFLRSDLNLKLRPTLLNLAPGTRIVSNTFTMGDWEPDDLVGVERDCANWCSAMMWIVPARVSGIWRLPQGDLTLKQEFQMVTGTLRGPSGSTSVINGRVRADQITLVSDGLKFNGRASGHMMQGTVTDHDQTRNWNAMRTGD